MEKKGVKFDRAQVIAAEKLPDGRIVFLETGNSKAGLKHIVEGHGQDFAKAGIPEDQIPDAIMKAVTEGELDGMQGKPPRGRPIYKVKISGQEKRIAVTTGSNGFIVGANSCRKEFYTVKQIKLMADYECHPLWNASDLEYGNIDPGTLPISERLMSALKQWADDFDRTLDRDNPVESGFHSEEEEREFSQRGAQLAQALQHELGSSVEVVFQPPH